MHLTAATYAILKDSRDDLARTLDLADVEEMPGMTPSELAMLRNRLNTMNGLIAEYERRRLH